VRELGITTADGTTALLAGLSDRSETVEGAILSLLGLDWHLVALSRPGLTDRRGPRPCVTLCAGPRGRG